VRLVELPSGRELRRFTGIEDEILSVGHSLLVIDDRDGDRLPEVLASAMGPATQLVATDRLVVRFSGSQESLYVWPSEILDLGFGAALCTTSDLDGDGSREIVVGAIIASDRSDRAGELWVLSLKREER
jgi:hypothetical protein